MKVRAHQGFTIVELIVVIVVIAILATVTTVSYRHVRSSAQDTAIMSNLSEFADRIELSKMNRYQHSYPDAAEYDIGVLKEYYAPKEAANIIYCTPYLTGAHYALIITSKTGNTYYISDLTNKPVQDNEIIGSNNAATCLAIGEKLGGFNFVSNYGGMGRPWTNGGNPV